MTGKFNVEIVNSTDLMEIEGSWTSSDFTTLLDTLDFGDSTALSAAELREMCLMSLQDQDPIEAAYTVLKHVIGDDLREGQLRNMSTEMSEEKLWEEYVEPAFHERLFKVGSLLFAAMPQTFPKTDAVNVSLQITASDPASATLMSDAPDKTFVVRLLADGMEKNAVLHRLFEEQLAGEHFPNAANIIWNASLKSADDNTWMLDVIGSGYWLNPLLDTKSYESTAFADEAIAQE